MALDYYTQGLNIKIELKSLFLLREALLTIWFSRIVPYMTLVTALYFFPLNHVTIRH